MFWGPIRHRNFSRETRKREICWREISHGKIRREKREIVKSKIRVFWPKLKWKYKKTHVIFFFISNVHIYSLTVESNLWWSGSPPSETWVRFLHEINVIIILQYLFSTISLFMVLWKFDCQLNTYKDSMIFVGTLCM